MAIGAPSEAAITADGFLSSLMLVPHAARMGSIFMTTLIGHASAIHKIVMPRFQARHNRAKPRPLMTDPKPPKRIFPDAKVDAAAAKHVPSSPQTESEAYKLAFQDKEFLLRAGSAPGALPARAAEARIAS